MSQAGTFKNGNEKVSIFGKDVLSSLTTAAYIVTFQGALLTASDGRENLQHSKEGKDLLYINHCQVDYK